MKSPWSTGGFLLSALLAIPATARQAYISVPQASKHQSDQTVSPDTARLVLAQQLGLSDYHSCDALSPEIVDILNSHGGQDRDSLFGQAADQRRRRKVLLFLEGVEEPKNLAHKCASSKPTAGLHIDSPPVPDINVQFLKDLAQQARHRSQPLRHSQSCEGAALTVPADLQNEKTATAGCDTFLHSKLDKPQAGPVTTANIRTVISNLHSAADSSSAEVITVFLPPAPSTSIFKRSTAAPSWGEYIVPRQAPDTAHDDDSDNLAAAHALVEDIKDVFGSSSVADAHSSAPTRPTMDKIQDEEDTDTDDDDSGRPRPSASRTSSSAAPSNTSPPVGILPKCYTSEADCNKVTHGCSGHGSCKLAFDISHNKDGGGVSTKTRCYSCQCEVSTRLNYAGANKTTKWAGPACQKKDVSMEFWLLGGVTVGLVGVIGWAVSLLSTMGGQELPSVIGAGVAGLGARGK